MTQYIKKYINKQQKLHSSSLPYNKGKFIRILVLTGCICAVLSGCGGNAPEEDTGWEEIIEPDADSAAASVDGGNSIVDTDTADADTDTKDDSKDAGSTATDIEITIPAGIAGGEASDDHIAYVDEDTANITYALSENERDDIVNQLAEEITGSISTILEDKEYYPNIVSISPSEDYTEFTIALEGGNMNVYESMLVMSFYIVGDKYQIYNGVPAEDAVTVVRYVDSATGDVISETDSTSMGN